MAELSIGAPTTATVASDERTAEAPKNPCPISAPAPLAGATSFWRSLHAVAVVRVNTHAAPRWLSDWPPMSAVLASSDADTALPNVGVPTPASPPVAGGTSLVCSAQVPLELP